MNMNYNLQLVPYTRDFLIRSWDWLNDEYVKYFTDTPDFTYKQQDEWFYNLEKDKYRIVWGVSYNGIPVGACGLKISATGLNAEYWRYIGETTLYGKGIGNQMMESLEQKAINMGIKELFLKVLFDNERAIKLYMKRNFIEYQRDNRFIWMKKTLIRNISL